MKHLLPTALRALFLLTISIALNAQPREVTQIPWTSGNFFTIGDLVFFTSRDSLWRTDGTAEGTIFLKRGFDNFKDFTEFRGQAYFLSDVNDQAGWRELWRSDGTPGGTILLKASSEYDMAIIQAAGNYLYFAASDAATGHELYRTNGTAAGTALVRDINPGNADALIRQYRPYAFYYVAEPVGDYLFFAANNGTHGKELWKTNGTASGTVMVQDINPGPGDGIGTTNPVAFENRLYFHGINPTYGAEPWVSDGTAAGTVLLKDIVPGPTSQYSLQYASANNGWLYFSTNMYIDESSVFDLWKTDGSAASTLKVQNLCNGAECRFDGTPLTYNGKLHFLLYQEYGVNELWATDGTTGGTEQLYEAFLDGGIPFFKVVNDLILFYTASQGFSLDLYRSDGTAAGTTDFWAIRSGYTGPNPIAIANVNELVFFADHDVEAPGGGGEPVAPDDALQLMQTDGRTVRSLQDIFGMSFAGTRDIVNYYGKVVFTTHDPAGRYDDPKQLWIYDPDAPVEEKTSFTIVNADTDEDIQEINEGDIFIKPANTNINIRYNPVGTPGSVVFKHQGKRVRTENAAPYAIRGDLSGDYNPWPEGTAGSHTIAATPYTESGGNGSAGPTLQITFTIENEGAACMASGTILREYWDGVQGNYVSQIPVNEEPTSTNQLTVFEGPENFDTNYGTRIRGYICPPATGQYTFWIASNDHSELWLSTDDQPANKIRIAYLTRATGPEEWNRFASQKSSPVNLETGKRYYIEALHKQGIGSDHIAVGWQLPGGTMERPIPGSRLSPFEMEMNMMASSDASLFSDVSIYPNPVQSSNPEFTIAGFEGAEEAVTTQVEIRNMTGELVFSDTISCGGDCDDYPLSVNELLAPGVYHLNLKAKGLMYSKRLLVR